MDGHHSPPAVGTRRSPGWLGFRLICFAWLAILSAAYGGPALGQLIASPAAGERQIVVVYRSGASTIDPRTLAGELDILHRQSIELPSIALVVSVFAIRGTQDFEKVSALLGQRLKAIAVDGNQVYDGFADPSFSLRARSLQYALDRINAGQAASFATGRGVRIALIDGDVDVRHPVLAGKILARIDLIGEARDPDPVSAIDEARHGTGVAGIILADGRMIGLAPEARAIAIKAFAVRPGEGGRIHSSSDKIVRAIDVALRLKARVINMSFGGPRDRVVEFIVAEAVARGAIIVAAAGNIDSPDSELIYPAAYPGVIAVAATDTQDKLVRVPGSQRWVAIAAPGIDVITTAPGGGFQALSGSSIAAAHVSGLVALLLELRPTLGPVDAAQIIRRTARPLPATGDDSMPGLIDVGAALAAVVATAGR